MYLPVKLAGQRHNSLWQVPPFWHCWLASVHESWGPQSSTLAASKTWLAKSIATPFTSTCEGGGGGGGGLELVKKSVD